MNRRNCHMISMYSARHRFQFNGIFDWEQLSICWMHPKINFSKNRKLCFHFEQTKVEKCFKMHTPGSEVSGFIGIFIIQVTFVLIFGIFVRYDDEMLPMDSSGNSSSEQFSSIQQQHRVSYPRKFEFERIFPVGICNQNWYVIAWWKCNWNDNFMWIMVNQIKSNWMHLFHLSI